MKLRFITLSGIFHKIRAECDGIFFQKENDRRTAILEIPFFFATENAAGLSVVAYFTDQHGADFHLCDITKLRGADDGIFARVFFVDRNIVIGDRIYRVKDARNEVVFRLDSGDRIMVAVIISDCKPQNKKSAAGITGSEFFAAQERSR